MANIIKLPYCKTLNTLNNFLANFDCNNILCIDNLIELNYASVESLEEYIIKYSVKLIFSENKLCYICDTKDLDFLKNMVDYGLLQLTIPIDITHFFVNEYDFDPIIDKFKWYYYSGWKINYDPIQVFYHIIDFEDINAIRWWHENYLLTNYSEIIFENILTKYGGTDLDYILDIIISENVAHMIKYFEYIDQAIEFYEDNSVYLTAK